MRKRGKGDEGSEGNKNRYKEDDFKGKGRGRMRRKG
jgi:hypothetical protein